MYIIGLTGGIGCGKSTVSALFKNLGVLVIDADVIGKTLVQPNTVLLTAISKHFGPSILHSDGSLNRSALRERVFKNANERKELEALMHPAILAEMLKQSQLAGSPYCILSIPLLLETGQEKYVNRIVVVDAPVALQRQRVVERSGLTEAQVTEILNAQISRDRRLSLADDIIDNSKSPADLPPQIATLHKKYLAIAQSTVNLP